MIGSSQRALASETVNVAYHAVDSSNTDITAATDFEYSVYRISDGEWLDFADSTFKAKGSVGTLEQGLTLVDNTDMPGIYRHSLDLSAITNHATTADTFILKLSETTGSDLGFTQVGEIVVNPPDLVAAAHQGAIYIDAANGTSGSTLGIHGTSSTPCTTIAEADTLSTATGIKTYNVIDGPLTLDATTYNNYRFVSTGYQAITLNSKHVVSCHFEKCTILGTAGASSDNWIMEDCLLAGPLTLINPIGLYRCFLAQALTLTLSSGKAVLLQRCVDADDQAGNATIDLNDSATAAVTVADWTGNLTIAGVTNANSQVSVRGTAGKVTIGSGNTAGTITVAGTLDLSDSNGGSTVVRTELVRPLELRMTHALQCGNYTLDTAVFDANGFATSQRLRIWDSAANVPSSADGSETTGLLGTITLTATAHGTYTASSTFLRGTLVEA